MTFYKSIPVLAVAALLSACGGDSSSSSPEEGYAKVSFSVSDAPVDDATEVNIGFYKLEFKHSDGTKFEFVVDADKDGNDYQHLNLLDYPGSDAALILTDKSLPIGEYKELIIHTLDDSYNDVVKPNGTYPLKVPSQKLKLGGFEVTSDEVQSFTIEFDLRKSLVPTQNGKPDSAYNIKPHGVTIVDNSDAVSLFGTVDDALIWLGDGSCISGSENYVYLYEGHLSDEVTLIDNVVVDEATGLPSHYAAPYASTAVNNETGEYEFGFIPPGDYTVAFTCNGMDDDPIEYDGIQIANPENQRHKIELRDVQEKEFDFEMITE